MDTKVWPGSLRMEPMGRLTVVFRYDPKDEGAEGQIGRKSQGLGARGDGFPMADASREIEHPKLGGTG